MKPYIVPTAVRFPEEGLKRAGILGFVGRAVKYAYLQIVGEFSIKYEDERKQKQNDLWIHGTPFMFVKASDNCCALVVFAARGSRQANSVIHTDMLNVLLRSSAKFQSSEQL